MADVVNMPKLGFDMAEGTLVRWVVAEGETVAKGAVLAEIETDKATVEVESNYEGVVLRHLIEEGTPVPVGDAIAVIGAEGEEVDVQALVGETAEPAAAEKEPEAEKPVVEDEVADAQEPEAEKPVVEDEVADAQEPMHREAAEKAEEGAAAPAEGDAQLPDGVRASPLARRIAEEKGIDLGKVDGSGPRGRIVKKDVETFSEQPAAAPAQAPAEAPKAEAEKKGTVPPAVFTPLGPPPADEEIPLSRLRAAIGRRMVEAKQQVPHFYVTHEYNMAPVMALRKQINGMLGDDEKLSVNDFIIKAAALALRQFPNLNASLAGDKVIRHGQVNMGVAVAVEGGLLTVVCRDADRKSLRQISAELQILVGRAREGKVRPDDIEGSTFSISNMGMLDVESFTAIINPPEAAILAVGSARELPVVEDGEIKPGIRMKITISVDHRVSDGAEAARYLQALEAYLHEPLRMML